MSSRYVTKIASITKNSNKSVRKRQKKNGQMGKKGVYIKFYNSFIFLSSTEKHV